jgi:hypothetical protein
VLECSLCLLYRKCLNLEENGVWLRAAVQVDCVGSFGELSYASREICTAALLLTVNFVICEGV